MPGITGIISENVLDEKLLDRMINSLKHEEFHQVDKYFSQHFACARIHLGIFNPEQQPIFNEDRSLCILLEGKIYDYKEEMNELKKKGYKFNYENDPEFCLYSYEEYGKDFVKTLNGNFVLLIYDFKNRKVIIANDRFGFRVHYYALNNGKLLFVPEAKAILQDETFKKELNDEGVAEYFALGEFWGDKTLFNGIRVLIPASILTYDGRDLSIEKYWYIKYEPNYNKSENEFVDELVKTFTKAVRIRMEDNFRYGIELSGGLDSRSVLAAIPHEKRKDIIACTFGNKDCDEIKIAEKVSKIAGIKEHIVYDISPELLMNNSEHEILLTEGRNTIGVSFTYPIIKEFREKVDVMFDGFAMDLTLGGSFLNKERINCGSKSLLSDLLSKKRLFQDAELCDIFRTTYYNNIRELPAKSFINEFNKIISEHPGNKSDEFAMFTHVAWMNIGEITVKDLLEISHPPADNDFIDLILTIPPEMRLNHNIYRKFLIKLSPELAKITYNSTMVRADAPFLFWRLGRHYLNYWDLIKKMIRQISKGRIVFPNRRGYVNYDEWFQTNEKWQEFFSELLLKENDKSEKFFNLNYIEKLLHEQMEGKKNNYAKLQYIGSFKIFLRLFF
jgi:asparagine synthase (glutamine-hydrolysing)